MIGSRRVAGNDLLILGRAVWSRLAGKPDGQIGAVAYLNYKFSPLDNISFRPEFYDDMEA
jgi:hypothetical protein